MKRMLSSIKVNIKPILGVVIALVVGSVVTRQVLIMRKDPAQKELSAVKATVGKLMLLPKDEEPTLAVVTDKKKVTDPFLASKVDDGDEVLVYTNNQIVIVYRPKINKIVTVGKVNADPALAESVDATLTILDGSNNPEKVKEIIDAINAAYPDMKITDGGKASRTDFPTTLIIDNKEAKDYLVDALAKLANGKRGIVPISEVKQSTDLEIIVGLDN